MEDKTTAAYKPFRMHIWFRKSPQLEIFGSWRRNIYAFSVIFLSLAISWHVLLQTWYWKKHGLDLIQYGYPFGFTSSCYVLARNQMLWNLTSHTNFVVYFNMLIYYMTFCSFHVLWNIMSIMFLNKSKGHQKQCKINL